MKPIKQVSLDKARGPKAPKPGHPPLHRLPIVDHEGNMRGHVGNTATAATVARFIGHHGAKLGMHEGRKAWIGDPPPAPPPPDFIMGPDGPMLNPAARGKGTEQSPFDREKAQRDDEHRSEDRKLKADQIKLQAKAKASKK